MLSLFAIFVAPLTMIISHNHSRIEQGPLSSPQPRAEKDHEEKRGEAMPIGLAAYTAPGPAGRTSLGTITWSQISDAGGDAARATLYFADLNATVTVTFSKNNDPSLEANYLIQTQMVGVLEDGPIRAVPRVLVKQSRRGDGRELAGTSVSVTSDLFWYALSSDSSQDSYNRELLRTASWVELSLLLRNMTESHLIFESVEPGTTLLRNLVPASPTQEISPR